MGLGKVSKIWMYAALIFLGFSGGIVVGVIVDVDTVYETTIKKIKQNKSPEGTILIDVETGEMKSKQEIRKEKREIRRAVRRNK